MSLRFPAGYIGKADITPTGSAFSDAAPGVWTITEALYWKNLGLWPTFGPTADFDFVDSAAAFDPRITYTGDSARMYFDSTGTLRYAPMNVIRNNTMQGASAPSTLPTNWTSQGTLGTLSRTIVGVGVENGISYIDVRWSGTTSSTNTGLFFESTSGIAATNGQTWAAGTFIALVGGSVSGLSVLQRLTMRDAALANLGTITGSAGNLDSLLTSTMQRFTDTFTTTNAATAFVQSYVGLTFSSGAAIDITLRIGLPQLQLGSVATDPIPTTTAAVYLPRSNAYQDHNPATLAPLGFLIEEQRTNSIRNNTMQGAVVGVIGSGGAIPTNWSVSATGLTQEVVSVGQEKGIDYVDIRLSGTTGATFASIVVDSAISGFVTNTAYTLSSYVKRVGGSTTNVNSIAARIRYNLSPSGNTDISGSALTIPSTGDLSAYRPTLTGTTTGTVFGTGIAFYLLSWASGVAVDITLRIGLPQLELGAFATSPILTTAAAATRLADVASITGTNFSSFYNQTEGTVVARVNLPTAPPTTAIPCIVSADDATSSERIQLFRANNSGTPFGGFVVVDGGVAQANIGTGLSQLQGATIAGAYKADNFAACATGFSTQIDTSGTIPTVTRLQLGNGNALAYLNGHIQSLTYYNRRLPNQTLQSLTV